MLEQKAFDAFVQGSSLADHFRKVARDYYDMLSPSHADRPRVEQFQQRLAHLGQELTLAHLRELMPTLPSRLAKRFRPAVTAYLRLIRRDWSVKQDSAEQSINATPALDPTTSATIEAINTANPAYAEEQTEAALSPDVAAVASSPAGPPGAVENDHEEAAGDAPRDPASAASDRVFLQAAEEPSSTSAGVQAEPMDIDSTMDPSKASTRVSGPEPGFADASHDSAVESAGSPQAFGTPPEQPEEEDEVTNQPSQPMPQELPVLDEPRHSETLGEQTLQSEQQEPANASFGDEEEVEDQQESQGRQEHQLSQEAKEHEEEEDELVDELNGNHHHESSTDHPAQEVEKVPREGNGPAATADEKRGASPTECTERVFGAGERKGEGQVIRESQVDDCEDSDADALQDQSADEHAQKPVRVDEIFETQETQANADAGDTLRPAASPPAEADPSQLEGAEQAEPDEQVDEPQPSQQQANGRQDHVVVMPTDAAAGDKNADGTSAQAQHTITAPGHTEGTNKGIIDDLDSPMDPVTDRVATAVEAVEQALAADSEAHAAEAIDNATLASGAVTAADSSIQEDDQATAPSQRDGTSHAKSPAAAVSEARTVATPPLPSQPMTPGPDSEAQATTVETDAAMPDASLVQAEPLPADEAEAPQTLSAPSAAAPDAETAASPVPAAIQAVSALNAASATAKEGSGQAEEPSEPSVEAGTVQQDEQADVAENGEEASALVDRTTAAESHVNNDPGHSSLGRERATSQTILDSGTVTRPKRTVDDQMKSMLKDLSSVTGRRSSYRTMQKCKPLRVGSGSQQTIQDLVEHWQDPAKMIPWTCLQEIGPAILHKNAHKHLHLSMHKLMDKVSHTRSVQHLLGKLPERVLTRAIMEFPRVPHMLHCWNEEKTKYFARRKLSQPTDTKPEFRFADEQTAANATSTPLQVPDASSRLSRANGSPLLVHAMTQSRAGAPITVAQPANTNAQATMTSYISGPSPQAALPPAAAVLHQTLMQVGSQLLARTARNHPMATSPVLHPANAQQQQMRQIAAMPHDYSGQHVAAMPPGAVRPAAAQQPAIHAVQLQRPPQTVPPQQRQQHQQQRPQQRQQLSDNARREAMVKEATERVFSGLAADCLSFAEQVVGSPASKGLAVRPHFSEADVLHVVNFIEDFYKREVELERRVGRQDAKAEERYKKILRVQAVAMDVIELTKMLDRVKMCVNEAAIESLRRRGVASAEHWLDHLNTSAEWSGLKQCLLQGEQGLGMLSGVETRMLLLKQVDRLNKRLEAALESLMSVDDVVGWVVGGVDQEEREAQETIRKECDQTGRICCKHVVDILVDDSEQ